jgi:RNA polymerase sigma-54 factor
MLLQTQSPALRPLATAHLAQTMTLLEMTSAELRQKIDAALAANPALELLEEARCPHCRRPLPRSGPCPRCSAPRDASAEQPIVFVSPRSDFNRASGSRFEDESTPGEEWTAAVEDLPTFVLRQIAAELEPGDRPLAAHLLTSLDEDGLLGVTLQEVARYHHVPLARVEAVQHLIQRAEPAGVGSLSPQEAMLVQLEMLGESRCVPAFTAQVIRQGMDLLSRRAYAELARRLRISLAQAEQTAAFISENLNPFPARAHWGDIHGGAEERPAYQDPDVVITRLHEGERAPLVIEVVSPYAGSLRINPLFRQSIAHAPAEKATEWQAEMDEAALLVKCLQQRDHTLVRLMQRLAMRQRNFILQGDAHLLPLTRAQMAVELGVHESTISRAVAGKAVQLPNGKVIPLARWFDRSLNVRTALLQIVAEEQHPLSDTQIAEKLASKGFFVARRTVAKYRTIEGILPARLRQPASRSIAT